MKKALCMIALAAVSFGSVFAFAGEATVKTTHGTMQTDTTKKKMKKKMKKDSTMKKDTMKMKK